MTAEPLVAGATKVASESFSNDPVIHGLLWVIAIIFLLLTAAKPVRDWLRGMMKEDRDDKVGDAKSSAESSLYNHLSKEVENYRQLAEQALRERNHIVERVGRLEEKAALFEEAKISIDNLKSRLDQKDTKLEEREAEILRLIKHAADERRQFLEIILAKDEEISRRDERILLLENKVLDLEVRLARDEMSMGVGMCPLHQAQ